MKRSLLSLSSTFWALPLLAAVNVPLTVQEAIYPGSIAGVNRTGDPVSAGVPLPDDPATGLSDVNQLTLTGAGAGQFRVLGRWPSGRIKWVLVDTQASLSAGQTNTAITLTSGGSGNFGGPNLATDNGATIAVSTGDGVFTVKKANFNVIDQAVVGGKTLVSSGSSQGLVLTGPAPGQTTCPPCTTVYSSSNDPSSTAVIEENGPAKAVIRATGRHVDVAGNVYMNFTVRLYFYKGKSFVKLTSILRNADYGTSNTFASAYKGHQGYEVRLAPALSGALNYKISNDTTSPTAGSLGAADNIYLYQGKSLSLQSSNWCGADGCVPYTTDPGYSVVKNGVALVKGTESQYPEGWADLSDASGAGIQIGVYQLAAYGSKSLEFNSGGSDVRIGIWARQNTQPYYQTWPQWSIHDVFLNFHGAALASPANEFLKWQHYLLGRAPYTHYNAAGVFPYKMIDPAVEDAWYRNTASTATPPIAQNGACCVPDVGTTTYGFSLSVYPYWAWANGGALTQTEYRWSNLMKFLTRGHTGRYLDSAHFYRMESDRSFPHSDGFNWRDKPYFGSPNEELNGQGEPSATSLNRAKAGRNWHDREHFHWYGITDFYFMSGDETVREGMLDGAKDVFLNPNTYLAAQSPRYFEAARGEWNSRANGAVLIGAARFGQFLKATGDPDADGVLAIGRSNYERTIKPELCVSGYPEGCSIPLSQGTSRTRGARWGTSGEWSDKWCGVAHEWRMTAAFQTGIVIQGILELRQAMGPAWADYWESIDLAYGISRWILSEMYQDDGSGKWNVNGFHYYMAIDGANACTGPGETPENYFSIGGQQTVSMAFIGKHLVDGGTEWGSKFKMNWQRLLNDLGTQASDHSSYQPAHVIGLLNDITTPVLQELPITAFTANGNGSYSVSWRVPAGAQSYRVKWGSKKIVDWLNFNPLTNTFGGDPASTMPWFAATNATGIPVPGASGSTQTIVITTGKNGLTAANFSIKAYVPLGTVPAPPPPGPTPPATVSGVSGSGQSGTTGQPLASAFTVRVADANGAPVAGVTVTFAVTAGAGTLSPNQAVTDSQGLASSKLTLGPAAGTNIVAVTASTLSGSPVVFTATATAAPQPPSSSAHITWRKSAVRLSPPRAAQWQLIRYDPIGQTTIIYQSDNTSIYSNGIWHFKAANESLLLLGTSGSTSQACPDDTDLWPGDRHPMGQTAVDTRRKVMWLAGGVCGGISRADTYQLRLNANPSNNTWRRLPSKRFPYDTRYNSMVYDPDTDVLFTYGYDGGPDTYDTFVYCPTDLNPTPGTLSPAQITAGCELADDWSEVKVTITGAGRPPSKYPGMVYDTRNKKVLLAGGDPVQTWAYDVPRRTWTNLNPSIFPPTPSVDLHRQAAVTYNEQNGLMYYHDSGTPSDWTYDFRTNTWTNLGNLGGPTGAETIALDVAANALIGWSKNPDTGAAEIWIGQLSGTVPAGRTCDVNGDGVVNILDVQLTTLQSSGAAPCGTADLNRDGHCDQSDAQIVIQNILGGTCQAVP